MFAVIRIRGIRSIKPRIRRTMELLGLTKPNHCVVVAETPQNLGMLNVAKDYVAFGKIDEEMLFNLLTNKGKKGAAWARESLDEAKLRQLAKDVAAGKAKIKDTIDPVFCLHPPRKGYKNIKLHYPEGDLGKREDISKLLNRMI